jgi:hypothetical protein
MMYRAIIAASVVSCPMLWAAAPKDPVVEAAKKSTKVAVHQTRRGSVHTAKAVSSWVKPDPRKPSPGMIAEAKKNHKVWADHANWVYYKDGEEYGHTANGEFWSEADAKGAGYKLADVASK